MRKIILAGILALSLVAAAYAKTPIATVPLPSAKTIAPVPTSQLAKVYFVTFSPAGMTIHGDIGPMLFTWIELAAYRRVVEKTEAKEGAPL